MDSWIFTYSLILSLFYSSNCSSFDSLEFFQVGSMSLKYKICQTIFYFSCPILESAISPESPCSFYWIKVLRNHDLGTSNSHYYYLILLLGAFSSNSLIAMVQSLIFSLFFMVLPFQMSYKWEQYVAFWICLFQLHPRFCINQEFFIVWLYHHLFIHSHVERSLFPFFFSTIINKAAVNILLQVFVWT